MPSKQFTRGSVFLHQPAVVAGAVAMAWLADFLCWDEPVGWTPAVLVALVSLLAMLRSNGDLRRLFWPVILVVTAIVAIATSSSPLAITCGVLAVFRLVMACRNPVRLNWAEEFLETSGRLMVTAMLLPLRPVRDLLLIFRWRKRHTRSFRILFRLALWIIPIWIALIFALIFTGANPVMDKLGAKSLHWLADHLSNLFLQATVNRIAMWILVIGISWALLRNRIGRYMARRPKLSAGYGAVMSVVDSIGGTGEIYRAVVVRSLLVLNVLFLLQNGMDMAYLWGGATLPEGMTYAQYAHRGAYPLVGAAILAGIFVTAAFRSGSATERSPLARRLVYAWLAQTLVLTLSAAVRLHFYVDAYSLTYFRLATAVWMLLVMAGLVWIVLRLAMRRRNGWMIRNCLATAMAALFAMSLVNSPRLIANYNVRHCRELGGDVPLDVDYLLDLGPQALPALIHFQANARQPLPDTAYQRLVNYLQNDLNDRLATWRGWTMYDAMLRHELGPWISTGTFDRSGLGYSRSTDSYQPETTFRDDQTPAPDRDSVQRDPGYGRK